MVTAHFKSTAKGPAAKFSAQETFVLSALLAEVITLLEPEDGSAAGDEIDPLEELTGLTSTATEAPDDPVLARLLPDAYVDDAEQSADFRRYTEDDLRASKRADAKQVLESLPADGGRIVLDDQLTEAWLRALNDIRLAVGTRLGVTEESYKEVEGMDPLTPRAQQLSIYLWLGYIQETLVETQL